MKLKSWVHSTLHIGCVALLLWQGHRIQQLRAVVVQECAREMSAKELLRIYQVALDSMEGQVIEACEPPHAACVPIR
jgi:hypothetical protein